mmetsp:Transcript_7154/g.12732  ORF Transcript_7154/g.12732 Transcript_7154/m.12732 type:complete len:394 (+) Transcript_7154:1-1182(+)
MHFHFALICSAFSAIPIVASGPGKYQVWVNASKAQPHDSNRIHGRRLPEIDATITITQEQRTEILKRHNDLRAAVSDPCSASDMMLMTWDDDLEVASRAYAEQCYWGHDPTNSANGWGENLAMSFASSHVPDVTLEMVVGFAQAWYDEVVDTEWYEDNTRVRSKTLANPQQDCQSYDEDDGDCMIGHYTQLVEAKADKVGCAVVRCLSDLSPYNNGGVYLVCKYTQSGNLHVDGEQVAPYTVGAQCAACPSTCEGNLCTCADQLDSCTDALGVSISTLNGHATCDALMTATDGSGLTCEFLATSEFAHACPLYCSQCSPPTGLGMNFCGQSAYIASNTCDGQAGNSTSTTPSANGGTTAFAGADEGSIGGSRRSTALFFNMLLFLPMATMSVP